MSTADRAFFAWIRAWNALVLGIALACAPPASAAERRVALVIGNGGYQHVSRLVNPPRDARAMGAALGSVGFELIGGEALVDADKRAMEDSIRSFGRELRSGAVGLFYYAGHGLQVRGQNYLLPVTANVTGESDVKYELVDAGFVLDEMANAGNRLNVVILDACRNNPFGDRGLRSAANGLAQLQAPAGTVIGYATQPGAVAKDGDGEHSPYTLALLDAIQRPGLSLFDTFNEVGLRVKRATASEQQPWLATSPIEGQFSFVPGSAPTTVPVALGSAADPVAIELVMWQSAQSTDTADSYQAYLDTYPSGRFAALAKAAIAKRMAVAAVTPPSQQRPSPSAAPSPAAGGERFQSLGDGTILDTQTGLQWAASDNGSDIDWPSAKRYADNLTLGGHSDWRLPTQDELYGLYDESNPARTVACEWSQKSPPHVPPGFRFTCTLYWASETRGSEAAYVDFHIGFRYFFRQDGSGSNRVLPVRLRN